MAKEKPERGKKAAMIRDYLSKHPEDRNKDIATTLNSMSQTQGLGITFTAQEISVAKSKARKKAEGDSQTPAPAPQVKGDVATQIEALKVIIGALGKDQVKRIVDVL